MRMENKDCKIVKMLNDIYLNYSYYFYYKLYH